MPEPRTVLTEEEIETAWHDVYELPYLALPGETEDGAVCLALENEVRYLWIYFDSRAAADAFVAAAAA